MIFKVILAFFLLLSPLHLALSEPPQEQTSQNEQVWKFKEWLKKKKNTKQEKDNQKIEDGSGIKKKVKDKLSLEDKEQLESLLTQRLRFQQENAEDFNLPQNQTQEESEKNGSLMGSAYKSVGKSFGLSDSQLNGIGKITTLSNLKSIKTVLSFFGDEELNLHASRAAKKFNPKIFIFSQLILLICFIIFRSYMYDRATHWGKRLWTGLYSFVLYAFVSSLVLPYILIGNPYRDFVKRFYILLKQNL